MIASWLPPHPVTRTPGYGAIRRRAVDLDAEAAASLRELLRSRPEPRRYPPSIDAAERRGIALVLDALPEMFGVRSFPSRRMEGSTCLTK